MNPPLREGIVVTGLGAVSPIGVGVDAFTRSLRAGVSGVSAYRPSDPRVRTRAAALCRDFVPSSVLPEAELRRVPRLIPMALAAAREALTQARMPDLTDAESNPALRDHARRIGLVLGTGGGGIDFTLEQARRAHAGERPSLWSITNATHGNLAGELSIRLGLRGPSLCVSTGCASSSDAIGHATQTLRSDSNGAPDAMLVIGADAHVRDEVLLSMELLGVISSAPWDDSSDDPRARPSSASRPFDKTRDGFILGEGAWALVLERERPARRREARPIARILGYAATCDAHHRVRPAPDMAECARAITLALDDARLAPSDIGVVQCHGTGTRLNDELETVAIKLALGDAHAREVAASSVKSMIGHPQGASGAAGVVAAIGAMANLDHDDAGPFAPPTINLLEPDDACNLDYTPLASRPSDARAALINCLAFGAKNSAIVVGSVDKGQLPRS